MTTEYLSFCSIGGGSAWGTGDTPCEAVEQMLMGLTDWTTYYDLSEKNVYSAIYDVTEFDGWYADHTGLYGQIGPSEYSDDRAEASAVQPNPYPQVHGQAAALVRGESL